MSRKKARKADDGLAPTPERLAQGLVERLPLPIADEAGRSARPYRAVDTLAAMVRRGTITPQMHLAGDEFHALFLAAQLEPLRAADLTRLPDSAKDMPMSLRMAESRKKIWEVLKTLGGMHSPAGSCIWHVVGEAVTLKDWALHQGWSGRALSPETASGILIGALGMLQAYFGL